MRWAFCCAAYPYNLADHLGNNRVSFYSNSGAATLLQEDEYYSFGLRKSLYDNSNNNRYLYNGKEVQTDLKDQYDYGARFYDPVIGRFGTVDPLAEKDRRWSPYGYGHDNSIRFIDIDGLFIGPGDLFLTEDAAAEDFGKYYNGKSIQESKEYGSSIYKVRKDGKTYYSYSEAADGSERSVTPSVMSSSPSTATTHTHGDYLEKTDDDFSRTGVINDIQTANTKGLPSYVATPNGSLLKYDPKTKQTTVIATDLPSSDKDPSRKNDVSPYTGKSISETINDAIQPITAPRDAIPDIPPPMLLFP